MYDLINDTIPFYIFCYVGSLLDLVIFQFKLKTMNIRNCEECFVKLRCGCLRVRASVMGERKKESRAMTESR